MAPIEPEPWADSTLSGMIFAPKATPGDAELVVGRLGDGAGHVGAVAVVVARVLVVADEVVAGDELDAGQVGHRA